MEKRPLEQSVGPGLDLEEEITPFALGLGVFLLLLGEVRENTLALAS